MRWDVLGEPTKQEISEFHKANRKKARFLIDESLGPGVAELLREAGCNVRFVAEVGLIGHDDSDVFAFAWRENRILLTHDEDFLDDRRFPPHRNPGIVVLPGGSGEERELIAALGGMLSVIGIYRDVWLRAKIQITLNGDWMVRQWGSATGTHRVTRYRFPAHGMPLVLNDD